MSADDPRVWRVYERLTTSGLTVLETRSASDVTPNPNDPASVPPATVGPPSAEPGDPNGVEVISTGEPSPWPRSVIRPSPWSGWPAEWPTPDWMHVEDLVDIAWTCVDLNAQIISIMPPYLVGAASSTPTDWINNPNPDLYNSWIDFANDLLWNYQLGEALVLCTSRYANGYPARFHVVPSFLVDIERVPGGRRYTIGGADVTDDILHIWYRMRTDEARGHGPLEAGRTRLLAAKLLTRFAYNFVASGGVPTAILKHPAELNRKQAEDLQTAWVEARMSTLGLPAVLAGGLEYQQLGLNAEQLALVDLAKMNESRVAVMLGVPPFLAGLPSGGDSMTYSNVISLFDYHWRAGLSPKATRCMRALSDWLLPRGTSLEVNRDEYIKADPLTRAQTYDILIPLGILTVEQAAEIERYINAGPSATLTSGVLQ